MEEYEYYTLGTWKVKPGHQEELLAAWRELNRFFFSLPNPPVENVMIQSTQDETMFYSVGPWRSLDDIKAMRAASDPRRTAWSEITKVICDQATPGDFRVVERFPEK
jgi:hypothetical protein